MGKKLVIGDLHGHSHKAHSRIIDGVNSRLLELVSAFEQALDIGKLNGCSEMYVTGDVFHVKGNIKPSVMNIITKLFAKAISEYDMDVVITAGNHDYETFDGAVTAIDALDYIHNLKRGVMVCSKPAKLIVGDKKIVCIPYIHNNEDFKAIYRKLVKKYVPDVVLMHQGIDDYAPRKDIPETSITVDFLTKGFDGWVFSGHYHHPYKFDGCKVVNVGSPRQSKFGDTGDRGCWVFDPASDTVEFHSLDAPKFMEVDTKFKDFPSAKGNFVRINALTTKKIDALVEKLKEAGALSVTLNIEKEYTTAHEKAISLSTPQKMFLDYINLHEKYVPYRDKLVNLFDKICLSAS